MSVVQLLQVVIGTAALVVFFLLASSLSASVHKYVDLYERVVDEACKPKVVVDENTETLPAGVYSPTYEDMVRYAKQRDKQSKIANEHRRNPFDEDEYEGFPIGVYSEERRL